LKSFFRRFLFEGDILRLMGLFALAKPLGLVVQMLLAYYFGAGEHFDAYALAIFIISYTGSIVGRVFTSVVVPYTISLRKTLDEYSVFGFQNAVVLLFAIPSGVATLFLAFRGDLIIDLIGADLPETTRGYAIDMVRAMALPGMILLQIAMLKAILNLNERFKFATAMPLVNAVVMLAAIVLFQGRFGIWSVLLGFAASNLVQVVGLGWYVIRHHCIAWVRPSLPSGSLAKIWSLSWMMLVSQSIVTLYHFVDKMFAAGLPAGSISTITYSMTIVNFGVQVFSLTLIMVMFTRMSQMMSERRIDDLNEYVRDNLGRVTRIVVPASLIVSLAAPEVVRILYQRGEFSPEDSVKTAAAMSIYLLGLPGLITNNIVTRIFHSMQRMREKIYLAIQYLATNVIGNMILIGHLGVPGLAISTVVTVNIHLFLSFWVLHRYGMGFEIRKFVTIILHHYIIAAIVVGAYFLFDVAGQVGQMIDTTSLLGAFGIASLKAMFVLVLYGLLYLASKFLVPPGKRV